MIAHDAAWLFPGQGSQSVGMGWNLCRKSAVALEIFEMAEGLSGFPLRRICREGPEELLGRTDVLQPALTAVSLGCSELMAKAGFDPGAVAGHSLGEFAALYAARVISLEDTLRLVVERGRLMAEVAEQSPGGMLAVKRLDLERVTSVIQALQQDVGIVIANDNAPIQVVLSGSLEGLTAAAACVSAHGGEVVPLRVSGAWHSPLLAPAADRFRGLMETIEFRRARVPVYLNVPGRPETDPGRIRSAMADQMTSPVLWRPIIEAMYRDGFRCFYEVGPGKVLRGLLRQILPDPDAYFTQGIEGPRAFERPAPARQVAS